MTHDQLAVLVFVIELIILAAAFCLTYAIGSWLTKSKRERWWKLSVTAVLQVAAGLVAFPVSYILTSFLADRLNLQDNADFWLPVMWAVCVFLIVFLCGVVILKILPTIPGGLC
ncbi:MAG: hypothetical protein P4L50_28265 [Anaerolineaceae bacterium]|nr:hypothetical protein [Anaerolineaceae bacterium]